MKEEDFLISFSDLIHLIRQHRKKVLLCTWVFACFALGFTLTRPVVYVAEATFREKSNSDSGVADSASALKVLSLGGESNNSEAISWFKSRNLMEQLIKDRGLQAEFVKKHSFLGRMRDHLIADYAIFKKSKIPSLRRTSNPLFVRQVTYLGEVPLSLKIIPTDDESYQIFVGKKQLLGKGKFGHPFSCEQFSLVIEKRSAVSKQAIPLVLWPLSTLAEMLKGSIYAKIDTKDSTKVNLRLQANDRFLASDQLNTLLALYQQHLRGEHKRIIDEQVNYLEKRQGEMTDALNHLLEQHVTSISSDLSTSGFANSEKATEFLATTLQKYKQNLFGIELEMKRLKNLVEGGVAYPDTYRSEDDPFTINTLLSEIRVLKQQGDAIELALRGRAQTNLPKEFQGINLKTAQELYIAFCRELSEVESLTKKYIYVLGQMQNPSFELTSLSSVLTDPVSLGMIEKASELTLALKDESNRSSKEQERLKQELSLQREFLDKHLRQTLELAQLQEVQLQEKVHSIQHITLGLIQEQISILEKHVQEYIANHLSNLSQEKNLILEHQRVLAKEMGCVPSQWISEKMIDRHLDMNERLMGEVTKLVETKNIASNLEVIQAGPIDSAVPPLHPKSRHLFLFTLFGAFFGAGLSCSFILGRAVFWGIPATDENLHLANQHVSGSISNALKHPWCDSDLETCRHILSFFGEEKTLLLIRGEGPNYTPQLAELLFKKGAKTLLLPLSFDSAEGPGLLQYLEGKVTRPPITQFPHYDALLPGGVSRFSTELIGSVRFRAFLEELKKDYDKIIAVTNASPLSAEAKSLLPLFDRVAVNVVDEKLHKLQLYMRKNVTFILRRIS